MFLLCIVRNNCMESIAKWQCNLILLNGSMLKQTIGIKYKNISGNSSHSLHTVNCDCQEPTFNDRIKWLDFVYAPHHRLLQTNNYSPGDGIMKWRVHINCIILQHVFYSWMASMAYPKDNRRANPSAQLKKGHTYFLPNAQCEAITSSNILRSYTLYS